MAPTGYILPAEVDLTVLVGADFSTTIQLFTDTTQTVPFDLTGYTATIVIGNIFTLTSGSGITITPATGTILVVLTDTQTATVTPNPPGAEVHWSLKLTDGSGTISYPLNGGVSFVAP